MALKNILTHMEHTALWPRRAWRNLLRTLQVTPGFRAPVSVLVIPRRPPTTGARVTELLDLDHDPTTSTTDLWWVCTLIGAKS